MLVNILENKTHKSDVYIYTQVNILYVHCIEDQTLVVVKKNVCK